MWGHKNVTLKAIDFKRDYNITLVSRPGILIRLVRNSSRYLHRKIRQFFRKTFHFLITMLLYPKMIGIIVRQLSYKISKIIQIQILNNEQCRYAYVSPHSLSETCPQLLGSCTFMKYAFDLYLSMRRSELLFA